MRRLLVLFVHNRPQILQLCLDSIFNYNNIKFDDVLVINDASQNGLSNAIYDLCKEHGFTLTHFNKNRGYADAAWYAFSYIEQYNPDLVYWIEQDYVFKTQGLDLIDWLATEGPYKTCLGASLYDNPDFANKEKVFETFPRIYNEYLDEFILNENRVKEVSTDCFLLNRDRLYWPQKTNTPFGPVYAENISNSCGTMLLNWRNINSMFRKKQEDYVTWKKSVCDFGKDKRNLNDGAMSHGLCAYGKIHTHETCDLLFNVLPSIGNHINGGDSINGHIVPECHTFVGSPSWDKSFEETSKMLSILRPWRNETKNGI